ncbi:hypothetical protein ACIBQX_49875 [Nonomuraea sp. NPDC049714]|uniref:hypothetical protein n=1 Tax=Nonomuraea sp. NPDC049714 TaxID=3364357 RepID=UPI0037B7DAA3
MNDPLPNILAALSLLATALGLFVSGHWAIRRQTRPKRQLTFSLGRSSPLLADSGHSVTGLKISVNDVEVTHPVITILTITQTGWNDIPSSDFDQGRPIEISSSAPIVQVVDASPDKSPLGRSLTFSSGQITLGPELVRRGTEVELAILTDAEPEFGFDQHILNCRLKRATSAPRDPQLMQAKRVITYAIVAFVVFYLVTWSAEVATAVNEMIDWLAVFYADSLS